MSVVVSQQYNIRAITLFEDHIYWIERETGSIYRANKTQGTNKIRLITNLNDPSDLHMYHPYRQPEGLYHLLYTTLSLFTLTGGGHS